jgi:acyl-CoA reductase-like NAD-dependent aldehyde dehydrogenase
MDVTRMDDNSKSLPRYDHYIDGASVPPASGDYLPTDNPWTGETWAQVARGNAADAVRAVEAAQRAFESGAWPSLTPSERGRLLWKLGDLVVEHAPRLAEIEQRDNGKLITEVVAQVRYMGDYFRYYAGLADKVHSDVLPTDKKGVFAYTKYEAKGVVNVVTGLGPEVGQALVTHPAVAHVGFTGGSEAGRKIYELAARNFKTVTLELGGKSPNIVFDDADLDQAVKGVVSGIFAASGQSCQAGSRLLLQESIHDRFIDRLVDFMKDVKLGDPSSPDTQIGPIATRPQFEKVMGYIEIARQEGARCVLGGRSRPDLGAGQFVEPTIFTGVRNDMRIAQEEVFGPVLAVIPFKDEQDAIRIGNDIRYGLAAAVWTRDLRRAMLLTDKLKAGTVWVNNYRATSFTSPFGGYKESGIGRESGTDTIKEYLHTKCVWVSSDLDVPNPFVRR